MAKTQSALQTVLQTIAGVNGHVYFQPPESVRLVYPAIVYSLEGMSIDRADNTAYKNMKRYNIIYISKAPDETMCNSLLGLPYCSFDRRYIADNLYHDSYTLYF